jgi:hypothetical protein
LRKPITSRFSASCGLFEAAVDDMEAPGQSRRRGPHP